MSEEAKLRKLQYDLKAFGLGMLFFGLWGGVRTCLTAFLTQAEQEAMAEVMSKGTGAIVVTLIILIVIILVNIVVHIYIWRCACAEADGKKKWLYLVAAAGVAAVRVNSILHISLRFQHLISWDTAETIITDFVDLTELLVAVGLIIAAVRLKRKRKKAEKEAMPCN